MKKMCTNNIKAYYFVKQHKINCASKLNESLNWEIKYRNKRNKMRKLTF